MDQRPNTPQYDLTALEAHAAWSHELFTEYVRAGFSEDQAIRLTAAITTAGRPPQ